MDGKGFLEVDDVSVAYGRTPVLEDIRLAIEEGEFVALLGSSGCGKTTLLRTIAGFVKPIAGRVRMGGRDITSLPPDRRDMALVFQSYALWPHMTVRQNVGYGLKVRGVPRHAIRAKVDEILGMLALDGLGERNVTALSGGQRQRVALGRALAINPRVLLLDEPLSNLDARIRLSVRHEIKALQRRLGITAIHVTHDREEAMVMADRIVILNEGRIEQAGPPETVYNGPATPFVATFLGAENAILLHSEETAEGLRLAGSGLAAPRVLPRSGSGVRSPASGPVRVYFRAEAAILEPPGAPAGSIHPDLSFVGQVLLASYPGGTWRHSIAVGEETILVDAPERHDAGASVHVRVPAESLFLFPAQEGVTIESRRDVTDGQTTVVARP